MLTTFKRVPKGIAKEWMLPSEISKENRKKILVLCPAAVSTLWREDLITDLTEHRIRMSLSNEQTFFSKVEQFHTKGVYLPRPDRHVGCPPKFLNKGMKKTKRQHRGG